MIKWDGFGKSLKQLFSIGLISCFILLGGSFVSAGQIQDVGLTSYPSAYDSNYNLTFIKGGGVLSNFLGQGKSVLALNGRAFFWWATNGQPYYYDGGFQGFFTSYWVCDSFTGSIDGPSNCVEYPMEGDFYSIFKSFFKTIVLGDLAFYDYNPQEFNQSYNDNTIQVCWSSSSLNKSLCFRQHECYDGHGCSRYNYGGLTNSQGLSNLSYGLISTSWIGYAPGQNGYNGNYDGSDSQGSLDVSFDNSIDGDYIYGTCTYGEIINLLEDSGFNKYMCYGGLNNYDDWDSTVNYNIVPGTGLRLSQILSYSSVWDTPQDWFDYWNGLYGDSKYNAMWESYPAVYRTWFDIYYKYGNNKYFDSIREYCIVKADLDIDLNTVYRGNNSVLVGACDTYYDQQRYGYTLSSGGVILGGNFHGVSGLSGTKIQNNPVVFIQDFFDKAKSVIPTDYSSLGFGVLPVYIITFMIALILFRFLMH